MTDKKTLLKGPTLKTSKHSIILSVVSILLIASSLLVPIELASAKSLASERQSSQQNGDIANITVSTPNLNYLVFDYKTTIVDGQRYVLAGNWSFGVNIYKATEDWQPSTLIATLPYFSYNFFVANLTGLFPHCIIFSGSTSNFYGSDTLGYLAMYNLTSSEWNYTTLSETPWNDQGWITGIFNAPATSDIYINHGWTNNTSNDANIIWKTNPDELFSPDQWQAIQLPTVDVTPKDYYLALSESKMYVYIFNSGYYYVLYSWDYKDTWTLLKSSTDNPSYIIPGHYGTIRYTNGTLTFVNPKYPETWELWYSKDEGATWFSLGEAPMISTSTVPQAVQSCILIPFGDYFVFFNTQDSQTNSYIAIYNGTTELTRYSGLNSHNHDSYTLYDGNRIICGSDIEGDFLTSCNIKIVTFAETQQSPSNYSSSINIESNSTVTALAFNSLTSEITFTVNGTSGTTGYVKATISKNIMADAEAMKVYLDGNQTEFNVESANDSWVITFTYHHSSHSVVIDGNNSLGVSQFPNWVEYATVGVIAVFLSVAVSLIVWSFKQRSKIQAR